MDVALSSACDSWLFLRSCRRKFFLCCCTRWWLQYRDNLVDFVFTPAMRIVIRWLLRLVFRVRVTGDVARLQGGCLVVANCDSAIDGVLLGLFLPGEPLVLTTPEMQEGRWLRFLGSFVNGLSLNPSHPFTIKSVVNHVKAGGVAVIFPQGRVTSTGGAMKIFDAAAVIAAHCRTRVIPVRIHGTLYSRYSRVSGHWPKRRFPCVTLVIQPSEPEAPEVKIAVARRRRQQSAELQRRMQHMLSVPLWPRDLFGALLDAVSLHGRATPIIEDARRQPENYGHVLKSTLALGRLLSRQSAAEETVGVLLPNLSVSLAVILGLSARGRVPAMLNYSAGVEALRSACVAACVKTVVTSRQFLERLKLQNLAGSLPDVRLLYLEDLRDTLTLGDKLWLIGYALWWPRLAMPPCDPQRPAVVLFTSGSEGRPKGVVISHAALLANMAQLQAVIDFGPNDKYFCALPLYHSFGLIACALMPVMTGTRLFLYVSPLHFHSIPDLVYQSDATYIFGTSTFLGHYARNAHPYDFQSVRKVICGGEKLGREVSRLWRDRFGLRVLEGYGATECGPAMSLNTPLAFRAGSVGCLLPGVEHCLVPVPGLAAGGVLHVRSPNLMSGYLHYDHPGVIVPPQSECGPGWYSTGDVVEIDDEGFVTIVGRTRRFAKIAGEMVSLDLMERIAAHASPDSEHAATLKQVEGYGESTVLFTTDAKLDRMALVRAAREMQAPELAISRHIVSLDRLPLTGTGKTDYVTLRLRAEEYNV
jgi:acyl-[acyl-carrier-protein]-phospholipid O-acyltransferase/long-chain-fatty-acid--[acyl-carrier-protein] ligase